MFKRDNVGFIMLIIIVATSVAWYFSKDIQRPEVRRAEYKDRVLKGDNQDFTALIRLRNWSSRGYLPEMLKTSRRDAL